MVLCFSDVQHILKNVLKSDSFDAHYEYHFKSTASGIDLRNRMLFKSVNYIFLG